MNDEHPANQPDSGLARQNDDTGTGHSVHSVLPRLEVTIEHDSYVAGQMNVVRLLISNPFEQEIEIVSVRTPQTSSYREYNEDMEREEKALNKNRLLQIMPTVSASVNALALGGISIDLPRPTPRRLIITAQPNSHIKFSKSFEPSDEVIIDAAESAIIEVGSAVDAPKDAKDRTLRLLPRSTLVIPVSVKTRQWVLFTPHRFGLAVEITYRFSDSCRSQVVTTEMDIRPPLMSMVLGAVAGGALGSVVASLSKGISTPGQIFLQCMTSVLMSIIAAVSLSRRGNTQAFITVEDFFGGFFVGALIGYGGVAYFEQALLPKVE